MSTLTRRRAGRFREHAEYRRRSLLLQILDQHWREHLVHAWSICDQVVGLRAFMHSAIPLNEYKSARPSGMFEDHAGRGFAKRRDRASLSHIEIQVNVPLTPVPEPQAERTSAWKRRDAGRDAGQG